MTLARSTKTRLWFLGAGLLSLAALYCFAGAMMNGSFAAGGGTTIEHGRFARGAAIFFWLAISASVAALVCLVVGIVRIWQMRREQ